MYYHGHRYYAAWLGRWERPDPMRLEGGINRFAYVLGNPVRLRDPEGLAAKGGLWSSDEQLAGAVAASFNEQLEKAGFSSRASVVSNDGRFEIQFDGKELPGWATAIKSLDTEGVSVELRSVDPTKDQVIPKRGDPSGSETLKEAYDKDTMMERIREKPDSSSGPGDPDLTVEPLAEVAPAVTVPSEGLVEHAAGEIAQLAVQNYEKVRDESLGHPRLDVASKQAKDVARWYEKRNARMLPGDDLSAVIFVDASLKEGPVMFQGSLSGIGEVVAHEVTEHLLSWVLPDEERSAPHYGRRPSSGEDFFNANVRIHLQVEKSLLAAYGALRTSEGHGKLLYSRYGWKR